MEVFIKNKKGIIFKVIIDDEFSFLFEKYSYSIEIKGTNIYAGRTLKNKRIYLHRDILNPNKKECIDHIDGNGLNNRKCNLRICNKAQNRRNSRKLENCTSKFKGVCWDKDRNKWFAKIKIQDKTLNLGRFLTEIEAAKAYDEAATVLFGEFARINKI